VKSEKLTQYDLIWKGLFTTSVEHIRFIKHPDGSMYANSSVVGVEENIPFRIVYDVKLDAQWGVREVIITDLLEDRSVVQLLSDGQGRWKSKDGTPLAQFDDCIDIDFTLTPFTNTLPIRRLRWEEGVTHEIELVYITHPTFEVYPAKQAYTCRSINNQNMRFHFKMDDFEREITVNREGFVIDYPELFQCVLTTVNSEL
jgi:uncharacterized protein